MDYNNQFVQTGAQSDIGENLTTNIKSSYRMGAEIEAGWSPLSWLTIEGNATLSRNIIKDFDEMASVYWESSFRKIHYGHSTSPFHHQLYSMECSISTIKDSKRCGIQTL